MFTELPKLFDRNFAMGYVLPSVAFFVVSLLLLDVFQMTTLTSFMQDTNPIVGTALIVILAWGGGLVLLALNWEIYRFLEGYWGSILIDFFSGIERWRFSRITKNSELLDAEIEKLDAEITALESKDSLVTSTEREKKQKQRSKKQLKLNYLDREYAEHFPLNSSNLLPTSFGNTIRAFEDYPRIMYGIDGIPGWDRLQFVIPKDDRELIESAKAQTDLWTNVWFLALFFIIEYSALAIHKSDLKLFPHVPIFTLFIAWISSTRATSAAVGWGAMLKASFDIYLSDLGEKLGYELSSIRTGEQNFWKVYSQAIIYRRPDVLEGLPQQKRLIAAIKRVKNKGN